MHSKKEKKLNKVYSCSSCGQIHQEFPSLGFIAPFHYDILNENDKNESAELSEDFCIIHHPEQTDRFIRTVLSFKVHDTCETLDYGIWVSVSEESFNEYLENFKNETCEPIYFGMICNEIKDYNETTLGLHVNVQVRKDGIRPEILPHQLVHQLIIDWENGITFEDAQKRFQKAMNNVG
jgi:hypothetical protein